jgi:hypothetical protein
MNETIKNPKCIRKKECIDEIRKYINLNAISSLNKYALAKKYEFDWHTIDKWVENILKEFPDEKIEYVRKRAEMALNHLLNQNERIILNQEIDVNTRMRAMDNMLKTIETQIKVLESFNRKPKTAELIEIKSININKDILEYKQAIEITNKLPIEEQQVFRKFLLGE